MRATRYWLPWGESVGRVLVPSGIDAYDTVAVPIGPTGAVTSTRVSVVRSSMPRAGTCSSRARSRSSASPGSVVVVAMSTKSIGVAGGSPAGFWARYSIRDGLRSTSSRPGKVPTSASTVEVPPSVAKSAWCSRTFVPFAARSLAWYESGPVVTTVVDIARGIGASRAVTTRELVRVPSGATANSDASSVSAGTAGTSMVDRLNRPSATVIVSL